MLALAALPLVLLAIAIVGWLTHTADPARTSFRWFRYVVIAELVLLVVLAAMGATYEKVSAARARRKYPAPGKLIDVGGYRLHLDCAGQGSPTVILIYGMSGSYLDWYWVQPEVAKFARVCSYDRPGYGWSELSPKPRLSSIAADELHTLLQDA